MLTSSEILKEYAKCLMDPKYAIETYLQTFDKTQEGFVPFKLFQRQKYIVDSYEQHRWNIVTKPRQAGISTTTQAYASIKCAFADSSNPETVIVIANKLNLAKKFLKGIKDYASQLPRWVWGPEYYGTPEKEKKSIFIKDSQIEIELPNGSKIVAVATSTDALRGYTPTWLIFDEAAFIDRGAELYSAAVTSLGTGGKCVLISCVTRDCFVFTSEGIKQVSQFINDEMGDNPNVGYNIPDYTIMGLNKARTSTLFVNNGLQDTIKIQSTSAMLEGTKTHKVWAYSSTKNKFDWYLLDELSKNDYINVQYGFDLWGSDDEINFEYIPSTKEKNLPTLLYDKITKDLAYLIGLYISEGSTYKIKNENGDHIGTSVTITCGDDISNAITNCGFNYSSHDNLHYTISSKYFGELLEYLGFDLNKKAKDKEIPERLLRISRENIIAMVQGIMDGDGYGDSSRGRIGISLSSKKLVQQIRAIFLNFGILTDYYEGVTPPTKKVKVSSNYYRISANEFYAKKYYQLIGFRFKRKQLKESAVRITESNNQSEYIPNGKVIIRNILEDYKLIKKLRGTGLKANSVRLTSENKTNDLNRNKFVQFINYFKDVLSLDLSKYNIDKILFENGKWEKIKDISYSQNKTYDFSLPNDSNDFWCHSVIYNGILGHQTPNGYDELYYKTYEQAEKGENDYNVIELKWYQDPRYNKDLQWIKGDELFDEFEFTLDSFEEKIKQGYKPTSTWYRDMCKGMNNDKKRIAQELDVSFLGSGGNVIDDEYIMMHEKENLEKPKFVDDTYYDGTSGLIWIWNEPIEGHQYILSADVSRGDGLDFSTFQIIDFTTMEQVVEFQGKIPPDVLAEAVNNYGLKYNAYVVIDNIGVGHTTASKLQEYKYPNLHYESVKTEKGKLVPGFNVNGVRIQLISHLESMVRTNAIKIKSRRLLNEFKTFIFKNGRPDHMAGYNDDLIMALGMGLWVMETSFKKLKKLESQTKALLSAWQVGSSNQKTDDIYNTGFVPKQQRNKKTTGKPNFNPIVAKNMQDPRGEYLWLFSGLK